jgi:hypothetical protein
MTQHTELIALLRANADMMPTDSHISRQYKAAADALEATAKNAFEAMPHDIPRRMKREICVNAAWSGSMVSRMYTELRKAFTGEPYKANEDLDAALLEIERLRKDAERLDWLESSSESHGFCHTAYGEHRYYAHQIKGYPTVREVIDAAMKDQP